MKFKDYEIIEIHAEFCKTLANPKRLIILQILEEKEMTVSQISELLELPIANVSQHLKALRDRDIVHARKDGHNVYYSLSEPKLIEACNIIRDVIITLNKRKGKIINPDFKIDKP